MGLTKVFFFFQDERLGHVFRMRKRVCKNSLQMGGRSTDSSGVERTLERWVEALLEASAWG